MTLIHTRGLAKGQNSNIKYLPKSWICVRIVAKQFVNTVPLVGAQIHLKQFILKRSRHAGHVENKQ